MNGERDMTPGGINDLIRRGRLRTGRCPTCRHQLEKDGGAHVCRYCQRSMTADEVRSIRGDRNP